MLNRVAPSQRHRGTTAGTRKTTTEAPPARHSGAGRNPETACVAAPNAALVPAFAGTTTPNRVTPLEATSRHHRRNPKNRNRSPTRPSFRRRPESSAALGSVAPSWWARPRAAAPLDSQTERNTSPERTQSMPATPLYQQRYTTTPAAFRARARSSLQATTAWPAHRIRWRIAQASERRSPFFRQSTNRGPRIEDRHPRGLEIGHVSGDDRHTMHKRSRRDERITLAALVGYVQPRAALGYGQVDR